MTRLTLAALAAAEAAKRRKREAAVYLTIDPPYHGPVVQTKPANETPRGVWIRE